MQFLLIARMFGFSKHSDKKKKKSDIIKPKKSDGQFYVRREHIKSESGLCAMDEKTLKLLTEMDNKCNSNKTNLETHIVNDANHICQVTNTFTKNGRYTQIICTTFTPYNNHHDDDDDDDDGNEHKYNNDIITNNDNNDDTENDTPPIPTETKTKTRGRSTKSMDSITPLTPLSAIPVINLNNLTNLSSKLRMQQTVIVDDDNNKENEEEDESIDRLYAHNVIDSHDEFQSFTNYNNHSQRLHDEDNEIIQNEEDNEWNSSQITPRKHRRHNDTDNSLSNLVVMDTEKKWDSSELDIMKNALEKELKDREINNDSDDGNNDVLDLSNFDLSNSTNYNQYEDDENNGLILKDIVNGSERERRPSNLFRRNSGGRWKLDDLEDQEYSIKKQMMELQQQHSIINSIDHIKYKTNNPETPRQQQQNVNNIQ